MKQKTKQRLNQLHRQHRAVRAMEIATETPQEAVELRILAQVGILSGEGANELRTQNRVVLGDVERSEIKSW